MQPRNLEHQPNPNSLAVVYRQAGTCDNLSVRRPPFGIGVYNASAIQEKQTEGVTPRRKDAKNAVEKLGKCHVDGWPDLLCLLDSLSAAASWRLCAFA
jgi:hypothetical protein